MSDGNTDSSILNFIKIGIFAGITTAPRNTAAVPIRIKQRVFAQNFFQHKRKENKNQKRTESTKRATTTRNNIHTKKDRKKEKKNTNQASWVLLDFTFNSLKLPVSAYLTKKKKNLNKKK